ASSSLICLFFILYPPSPPLFPYTTLFRSRFGAAGGWRRPPFCCKFLGETHVPPSRLRYGVSGRPFSQSAGAIRDDESLPPSALRSEEHTSELQSRVDLVCRLLLEKKKSSN